MMGEKKRLPARPVKAGTLLSIRLLVVLWALFALPAQAQFFVMQADCGGILTAKEGLRPGLEDYVDLSSIHHDLAAPATVNFDGSIRAEPMSVDALRVVKSLSASSIGMIGEMARGRSCTQILIEHWLETGIGPRPIWKLTLGDAYIVERKEWHTGTNVPQESFSFLPTRLNWTYFREDGTAVEFRWDFQTASAR